MITRSASYNLLQSTQNGYLLAGEMFLNTPQNSLISTFLNIVDALVGPVTLYRVGILCTEFAYSMKSNDYVVGSRSCSRVFFNQLWAESEVYSIK